MTVDGTRLIRTLSIHSLMAGLQGAEQTSVFVDNCGDSARRLDVTMGVGLLTGFPSFPSQGLNGFDHCAAVCCSQYIART